MKHIDPGDFRAEPGKRIDVTEWPTATEPVYQSAAEYKQLLHAHLRQIRSLQARLYASGQYSLLLILQAMDSAGKDGIIKHVMSGVNPQGCQVFSFRQPSAEELQHDFLWRAVVRLPERGRIGIFNRSYYEEVLIVRVHPELLRNQKLPESLRKSNVWEHRFHSINALEHHLHRNGTRIVKLFLHLSKDEQRKRLLARIDQPDKNWKFSQADIEERKYWRRYMQAYSACISATSTDYAPWFIVPADDKPNARLIVSEILIRTLASLNLKYPQMDARRLRELKAIAKKLEK
jgi:PPK2 family polyphosphate:nucleotide phosphotransferase